MISVSFLLLLILDQSIAWVPPFFLPMATSRQVSKVATSFATVDLEDNPLNIVIVRNSTGHAIAFQETCPHRGAPFSGQTLDKEGRITCPYHSFKYDVNGLGKLTSGLGVTAGCSAIPVMKCLEMGEVIWVKPNCTDTVASMPWYPPEEFDPVFRPVRGYTDIKAPLESVMANVADSIHISSVHSFGNPEHPTPLNYKAVRVPPFAGLATFQYQAGPTSLSKVVSKQKFVDVDNWFHLPSSVGTRVRAGTDIKVVHVHALRLSLITTRVFYTIYRNFLTSPLLDPAIDYIMRYTLNEDKQILERCNHAAGGSFHSKYDKLQRLYRRAAHEQHC